MTSSPVSRLFIFLSPHSTWTATDAEGNVETAVQVIGVASLDRDGDGHIAAFRGGPDCNDVNPDISPVC